jgi:hypothetical protein
MSDTGTIYLPGEEPEWREGVDWTPYTALGPHPWEPEHPLFDGYCPKCGGSCLVGFGNR